MAELNESKKPIKISIVSGKGGCGKTRIATTMAYLLSKFYKVLLVDFDFHNQGLTTLLDIKAKKKDFTIYEYIKGNQKIDLTKINENIYFLPGILSKSGDSYELINELEKEFRAQDISDVLMQLVKDVSNFEKFDFIIFDNTGLPDTFSIGSALSSDRVLIITQPEKVSWKGALNFYSAFEKNRGNVDLVKFVINNITKYTISDLREAFGYDFEFISYIPFERGIFETFGKDPFKDELIETSNFYQKISLLIIDILKDLGREDLIIGEMMDIEKEEKAIKVDLKEKLKVSDSISVQRMKRRINLMKSMLLLTLGTLLVFGVIRRIFVDILYRYSTIEILLLLFGIVFFFGGFYYYYLAFKEYALRSR